MDCGLPDSSVYQDSPGKNTGVGSHSLLDLPDPGIKPRSPALQADSLPSEPPGMPKSYHLLICFDMYSSMIFIHSYEMSKTGKSEIESKLDFSDSGTTPLNCIFHWVYFMVYEIYLQKRDISQQNCKNKKKLY